MEFNSGGEKREGIMEMKSIPENVGYEQLSQLGSTPGMILLTPFLVQVGSPTSPNPLIRRAKI